MRLIDVDTLKLHEFFGSQLQGVYYAILSHTWLDEEVSFQEIQNPTPTTRSRRGYAKIVDAAHQAKSDGLKWVWVDTCCIDKTSSAELSEAINSMYIWYQRSAICYAYLADVDSYPPVEQDSTQFRSSRWFFRGWTLQELIAPERVVFYAKDWMPIGEKFKSPQPSVITSKPTKIWGGIGKILLREASGIPFDLLFGARSKESYSVAQRMSWASKRVCTRVEDTAYCLLGLFGINMPLLYGEEERAFTRLQEEIIRTIDDHSIYAWTVLPAGDTDTNMHVPDDPVSSFESRDSSVLSARAHSILAPSPQYFKSCDKIVCTGTEGDELSGLTKHGLRIHLQLQEFEPSIPIHVLQRKFRFFQAPINCCVSTRGHRLSLLLVEAQSTTGNSAARHFIRFAIGCHLRPSLSTETTTDKPIYIKQRLPESDTFATRTNHVLEFDNVPIDFDQSILYQSKPVGGSAPLYVIRVTDPVTRRAWSPTFGCIGSDNETTHAFILEGNTPLSLTSNLLLVCQTMCEPSEGDSGFVLHASVSKLPPNGLDMSAVAGEAAKSHFREYGRWNDDRFTRFPCRLPEVEFLKSTVAIQVSVVAASTRNMRERDGTGNSRHNGKRGVSFIFTLIETKK